MPDQNRIEQSIADKIRSYGIDNIDADELSAIRDGAMSFDELLTQADSLRSRMEAAAETSSLPADVDTDGVDALVESIITGAPGTHGAVRG